MFQMPELPFKGEKHPIVLDLLTLPEVAEICRVSPATVKYWVSLRKLRSLKLGKHPLFRREELLRFVQTADALSTATHPVHLN